VLALRGHGGRRDLNDDAAAAQVLAWSRICFGLVLLLRTTPIGYALHLTFDTWPLLGWPDQSFRVAMLGLSLPATIVEALCVIRTAAAVAFTAGWFARPAGIIAGVSGYAVLAQDAFSFSFTQHLLYLGALVLGLTDCESLLAVRPRPGRAPRSGLRLVHTFVASIYFWAAVVKLRVDWLDGRTIAMFHEQKRITGTVADTLLATRAGCATAAIVVVVTEVALGPALLWRRTRRAAVVVALAMHATIEIAATPELIGWAMAALLLTFLDA
jgi:hypothetical protein